MRLLVCGGRFFKSREAVARALDRVRLEYEHDDVVLVSGACHLGGADKLAEDYAHEHGWTVEAYPVDHRVDGLWPGAGPRRNGRMLRNGRPDLVVAFPGGRGTADMIRQAEAAGVPVREVK